MLISIQQTGSVVHMCCAKHSSQLQDLSVATGTCVTCKMLHINWNRGSLTMTKLLLTFIFTKGLAEEKL